MTPEAQRIEIALACGWTDVRYESNYFIGRSTPKSTLRGNSPKGNWQDIPDYPNDLNAMHEAERSIGLHGDNFRGRMLRRSWGTYTAFLDSRFLTASERAQALLMTIKKWTNDA